MKEKCQCCGRILRDPVSIALGFGKKCAEAKGIRLAKGAWDLGDNERREYIAARRSRREATRNLDFLKGEFGQRPLFPEFDLEAIEETEKERLECGMRMAKALRK